MDLTAKFSDFFRSPQATMKEYDQALTESVKNDAYIKAVTFWREGIKKMQDNDLSGLEDIKKANETIKIVVGTTTPESKKQFDQLNESVTAFKTTGNLEEEIEMLEYQVGTLVDKLAEEGMKNTEEDDDSILDANLEEKDEKEVAPIVEPAANAPEVLVPAAPAVVEPLSDVPVVVEPVSVIDPKEMPAAVEKQSGYLRGFEEARARWKHGENPKMLSRKIAEGELKEKAYSFVNRYMEGFCAGFAFEEEVQRDMNPSLFEEKAKE